MDSKVHSMENSVSAAAVAAATALETEDPKMAKYKRQGGEPLMPPPSGQGDGSLSASHEMEMPVLATPDLVTNMSGLMSLLNQESGKQAVRSGVQGLETNSDRQKVENDKQLKELMKQAESLAKERALTPIQKAFKAIGLFFAIALGALAVAFSGGAAAPLLAGLITIAIALEGVVSLATDGKVGLGAAIADLVSSSGGSEQDAAVAKMVTEVLLMIVGFISGIASGQAVTQSVQMANNIPKMVQYINNLASSITSFIEGGVTIAGSVFGSQVVDSQAMIKKISSLLERIKGSIENDREFIKNTLEKVNKMIEAVNEIIRSSNETQAVILGRPHMA